MAVESNGLVLSGISLPTPLPVSEAAGAVAAGARVDGSDLTIGTTNDAASTNPAAQGTLIAISKGMLKALLALTGGTAAESLASGADVTEGSTTDAPLAAAATGAAVTIMAVFKGLFNLFYNGTAKVQAATAQWWIEYGPAAVGGNNANCAANTSYSGIARANNPSGTPGTGGYFTLLIYSSVAGTAAISSGPGYWTANVAANVTTTLKVPAMGNSMTGIYNNGGTAGTFTMATMYSAA